MQKKQNTHFPKCAMEQSQTERIVTVDTHFPNKFKNMENISQLFFFSDHKWHETKLHYRKGKEEKKIT